MKVHILRDFSLKSVDGILARLESVRMIDTVRVELMYICDISPFTR